MKLYFPFCRTATALVLGNTTIMAAVTSSENALHSTVIRIPAPLKLAIVKQTIAIVIDS